eukprot:9388540-Pyramimonas_sp.AAC.1
MVVVIAAAVAVVSSMPRTGPNTTPRRFQVPFERSNAPPRGPTPANAKGVSMLFCRLAFGLAMGLRGLKMAS